jgi:hypothetical protein
VATVARVGTAAPPSEAEVKAEYVERFTRFIEWPAAAPPPGSPFVVCTSGESELSTQLARALPGRRIKDRPVTVKRLREDEELSGCHILYLAPGTREHVARLAEELRGKPILSVGDAPGFSELGLIINLFVDDEQRVRFEINAETARASGLQISAKLMTLARRTTRGRE